MTKVTITLTKGQTTALLNMLADVVHDFDDYSFNDGQSQKQHEDEKAFYTRIYRTIESEYTKTE